MPRTPSQGAAKGSKSSNNNPRGINQYKDCPAPDDPRVPELLKAYQRKGITDRKKISKLLRDEHAIIMSDSTVARRRCELGLKASGKTTAELSDDVKRQLVLDQMAKDPEGKIGTLTVKSRIFQDTGIDITREWIRKEMRRLAPEAYEARKPHRKGTSPIERHSANGGSTSGEICSPVNSEPPRNADSLFAQVIQDNSSHDHFELDHSHPVESHSHTHQILAAPRPFTMPTQLQDMMAETEANMTTLTRHLRALGSVIHPLDVAVSQSLLKCMESAAFLEREITRVMST